MPNQFPTKTALALATAVAALTAFHLSAPPRGLSPAIFPEAAHVTLLRPSPAHHPPTKQPDTPPSPVPSPRVGSIPPRHSISPFFIDDSGSLDPFLAELHLLETINKPNVLLDMPLPIVTVLHYGDSPTTADLITGDIRDLLQQRFGDAGRGFLLTAKPWAWYQHRGVDLVDKNWQISTAVGKGRPEVYGIGGAAFTGDPSASTHITLKDPTQTTLELSFLAQPNGGSLTLSANHTLVQTIATADPHPHPAWQTIPLPPATKTIDLNPTSGTVTLFGANLLTGRPGIVYDSLGLNGASTSVLSNGFNAEAWQTELEHTGPTLVIINYGTNESSFGPYVDKLYESTLRATIARIRAVLPNEPILIMSPMDRGRRVGVDQIETYDTIPRIVAIQRRVAAELNCAFFDTFNAMGGDGTMSRWYTGHPRLVAGDLIHPTPQGAALVAHLFIHDLSLAYDRYPWHTDQYSVTVTAKPGPNRVPRTFPPRPPTIPPAAPSTPKPKPSTPAEPLPPPVPQPTPTPEAPQA